MRLDSGLRFTHHLSNLLCLCVLIEYVGYPQETLQNWDATHVREVIGSSHRSKSEALDSLGLSQNHCPTCTLKSTLVASFCLHICC